MIWESRHGLVPVTETGSIRELQNWFQTGSLEYPEHICYIAQIGYLEVRFLCYKGLSVTIDIDNGWSIALMSAYS